MSESNLVQDLNTLKLIPSDWTVYAFNNLVIDVSAGNTKLAKSKVLESGSIAVVDQGKELVAGYNDDPSIAVKSPPPYIVFGDHTRAFKLIDFPFIMGADGTKVLKPKNDSCVTKYLYYFFLSINVPDTGYNRHFKYLKQLKIPLPPLEEQKKIAAILDAADAYRRKTKALIEKYNKLTQSLFLDMFGDPVTNPMGWEKKKLGKVHKISSGGTPSRKNPEFFTNGTIPWVKTGELKGMYALTPSEYITEAALNNSSAKLFPTNTLLIAMYGATIGACSILNIEAATNQACAALLPTDEANVMYEYFFFSLYKDELIKLGVGGAQPNISAGILKSLDVMYPPLQLQNLFAERVALIEKQKQQAETSLVKAEELFNSLLQRAFRGELTN
jgi:type I restriction enzyme S subunit